MPLSARVKQLFDLAAEPELIEAHLSRAGLAGIVRRSRGLRVPGAFDGFELAARAVLGQQVTVKAATTFMSRFTAAFGEPLATPDPNLTHLAPTADRVADASVTRVKAIGIPAARAATLVALAGRMASGALTIEPESDVRELNRQLTDIPGIGAWTAEYVTMRAVHWPDAFPAGDIALRRAAGGVSAARLQRAAEKWRPWRAYAAMHLWTSLHGVEKNA
jgi:AraC family transcriptional regulator of adaptative response / DNA-3-methyladenine glycosylase II